MSEPNREPETAAPAPSDPSGAPARRRTRGPDPRTTPRPPAGDPLHPVWAALDRGDHALARTEALALRAHEDPTVRAAADDALARLRPDPVVLAVFALTALLLVALAAQYLGARGDHAPSRSPPARTTSAPVERYDSRGPGR